MIIGKDDEGKELRVGDFVKAVIEDRYGITIIERGEIRYKKFGYGISNDGFTHYLQDSVELIKL